MTELLEVLRSRQKGSEFADRLREFQAMHPEDREELVLRVLVELRDILRGMVELIARGTA